MSVTITRRKAIELGEQAVIMAVESALREPRIYVKDPDEMPEVAAFRQVLRITSAVARGQTHVGGTDCPMEQTVFTLKAKTPNLMAWFLAFAWDDVTRQDGLGVATLIRIDPESVMTIDQIVNFANEAVIQHPPREVVVKTTLDDNLIVGEITFAGKNKFRVDTPLAALFIPYDETEAVEYA